MNKRILVMAIVLLLALAGTALPSAAADPGAAPDGASTLGNYVWLDANLDGYHNGLEAEFGGGIDGVKVNLYQDLNKNGIIDPGEYVGTQVTGDNPNQAGTQTGYYLFSAITANGNQYIVEIDPSNFAIGGPLNGYILTSKMTYGLGKNPLVVLLPDITMNFVDADFGFIKAPLSIQKALTNSSAYTAIGDSVTFRITVTNSGPQTLDPVPLDDFYCPSCLKFVSASIMPDTKDESVGALHWINIGPLDPGGYKYVDVTFTTQSTQEMAWKEGGWQDYAPKGVPDFDERQAGWDSPGGSGTGWYQAGPTAVANSLWWFDSKFEPGPVGGTPLPPPTISDNYPLVPSFSPSNAWDDHDQRNVQPLINQLSILMGTTSAAGTTPAGLTAGVTQYIADRTLASSYTVTSLAKPAFTSVADGVRRSDDVILLLGFWQAGLNGAAPVRIGGHYVTASGADLANSKIAISDPMRNQAESGGAGRVLPGNHATSHPKMGPNGDTVHNDAQYISQDAYPSVAVGAPITAGVWGPGAYIDPAPGAGCAQVAAYQGKNVPAEFAGQQGACNVVGGLLYTVVEYAVAVAPKTNTLLCSPTTNIAAVNNATVLATDFVLPPVQDESRVTQGMDLGDLPDLPYPTLLSAGASHLLTSPLVLGTKIDAEANGQPTAGAAGDDMNGLVPDDEDGVLYQSGAGGPWTDGTVAQKHGGSLQIVISGGRGVPQVFMDFFGTGALQIVTLRDATGAPYGSTPWPAGTYRVYFDIPAGFTGVLRTVYTRVRLSSAGNLAATGQAPDGEVEDYMFRVSPTAVSVRDFAARSEDQPAGGSLSASLVFALMAAALGVWRVLSARAARR